MHTFYLYLPHHPTCNIIYFGIQCHSGSNLKLFPRLERCVEESEVTGYLPSHLCPVGDAVSNILLHWLLNSRSKFRAHLPVRQFLVLLAFSGRVGKWSLEKTLSWSLQIHIWVLKCATQYSYIIHVFMHFRCSLVAPVMSRRRLSGTEKHIPTHTCEQSSAFSSPDMCLWGWEETGTPGGKLHRGNTREALKRIWIWIWPLLSVTDLEKPEAHVAVTSRPRNEHCGAVRQFIAIHLSHFNFENPQQRWTHVDLFYVNFTICSRPSHCKSFLQ